MPDKQGPDRDQTVGQLGNRGMPLKKLGDFCITNASCESKRCTGTCVTPTIGDPCSLSFGCTSGKICDAVTLRCQQAWHIPAYTGKCDVYWDCRFNQYCEGNKCLPKKASGMKCTMPYECGDGLKCSDGICAERCLGASDCKDGYDCVNQICKLKSSPGFSVPSQYFLYIGMIGVLVMILLGLAGLFFFWKRSKRNQVGKVVINSDGFYPAAPAAQTQPFSIYTGPASREEKQAAEPSAPPSDLPPAYDSGVGTTSHILPSRPPKN